MIRGKDFAVRAGPVRKYLDRVRFFLRKMGENPTRRREVCLWTPEDGNGRLVYAWSASFGPEADGDHAGRICPGAATRLREPTLTGIGAAP